MGNLRFRTVSGEIQASIENVIIAGWTGRDTISVEKHIAELARIGVPRPKTTPCYYHVGSNLLTTDDAIDVVGTDSSGEAEFVLVFLEGTLWVGIGSDHTDRKVETYSVSVSKQMCPKPVGADLWNFEDVRRHWDGIMLRSWVTRGEKRKLYQEGAVAHMLSPADLIGQYAGGAGVLPPRTAMFCGTLPVLGTIGGGDRFDIELDDPVTKRSLRHTYRVRNLAYAD